MFETRNIIVLVCVRYIRQLKIIFGNIQSFIRKAVTVAAIFCLMISEFSMGLRPRLYSTIMLYNTTLDAIEKCSELARYMSKIRNFRRRMDIFENYFELLALIVYSLEYSSLNFDLGCAQ